MPESVAALQRIRATVLDATPRRFEGLERLMPDLQAMAQEQERAADPATRRALQDLLEEAGRLVTLESLKQGRVVIPSAGLEVLSDPRAHERRGQVDRFLARTQEDERAKKESRSQNGPVLLADRRTPDERIYDEQWNTIRSWHLSDGPEVQYEGELMTRRQFAVRSYILAQNAGVANMASNPLSAAVTFGADTTEEMIERANRAANFWAFAPALPGAARNLRNSVSPTRTLGRGPAAAPQTFDPETAIPARPGRRPETPAPASGRAGSPWTPSPTNRRLILAPEGEGGGGAFVGQAPRPEVRVEGGVERRAGPVFPAALPPTRAPGKPPLPDSATSPWQDSWLNPAGLPGSPYSGTGSRPAMPTPVAPPPISLPAPEAPSTVSLPPHRPPEPIAEPETPEAVGDPARDTGTIGDPVPAPGAAVQFAGPGPLAGPTPDAGTAVGGAPDPRNVIRGRVNSRNGPDFEEFAMPAIRKDAELRTRKGDQVHEQEEIPGTFVNTVPELYLIGTDGLPWVIYDAKTGGADMDQMAGYVDALDNFDDKRPPGRLVLVIPGPPTQAQESLRNRIQAYIAGTYAGQIKGKAPNEYQFGTAKNVTVEFLEVPGWSGELPPRFRGEP